MNVPAGLKCLEGRHPPPDVVYDRFGASKANREPRRRHGKLIPSSIHTVLHRAPEGVNGLVRIPDRYEPTTTELSEHFIVRGVEVLLLVDQDNRKLWECSSEQCGHVYLIVKVDKPIVGGPYALVQKPVR